VGFDKVYQTCRNVVGPMDLKTPGASRDSKHDEQGLTCFARPRISAESGLDGATRTEHQRIPTSHPQRRSESRVSLTVGPALPEARPQGCVLTPPRSLLRGVAMKEANRFSTGPRVRVPPTTDAHKSEGRGLWPPERTRAWGECCHPLTRGTCRYLTFRRGNVTSWHPTDSG